MSGRTVVLTGGTAGIGESLAVQLRRQGDRVIVIGRRAAGEDSLAVDLRRQDASASIESGLRRLGAAPWDVLIHNAALGWVGAFPDQSSTGIAESLEVNVWAPIALTHRLLPSASQSARIVFLSSAVAHMASPDYAVYAASKASVEAFARALRAERIGVDVQVLRPGATATEMLADADAARLGVSRSRFASAAATAAQTLRRLNGSPRWSSTDVPTRMAVGLSRWGSATWLARRSRIAWPTDSTEPDAQATAAPITPLLAGRVGAALITGAANGIGRALAVRFADEGFRIVGVDCDETGLDETARLVGEGGRTITTIVADLGNVDSLASLADQLESAAPFDVVIHNAGVNRFGRIRQVDLAEQRRVFEVNLLAPLLLTRDLTARLMVAKGCRLGFVSSLSHFVGYPGSAVYAATKSGLASFAASLAAAGRSAGFSATTIFPGPTRTRQARENSPDNSREHRRMDPEVLAVMIHRAMMSRKNILIPGVGNRFAAFFGKRFSSLADALMQIALLRPTKGFRAGE